ncbi:dopamine beta-hydroxylase [Halyomorpha halys]|uniref:dopamine beta-hydroxylase n=1 Tax=Halyomorpha halys TaxID=286706 RepID=UPI0034D17B68
MKKWLAVVVTYWAMALARGSEAPPGVYVLPLDPQAKHRFFWTLDYVDSTIQIEVQASISSNKWFGIGFSDRGERSNADWCIFVSDKTGRARILDAWTDDKCLLTIDQSQDCKGLRHTRTSSNTSRFSFYRKFDTCEPQDYVIERGTTHIVWTVGDGRIDGRNLCSLEGGFTRTEILKPPSQGFIPGEESWHLTVTAGGISVPSVDTTYYCRVTKLPPQLSNRHHLVQICHLLFKINSNMSNWSYLHGVKSVPQLQFYRDVAGGSHALGRCEQKPKSVEACKKVMAAWAMGATPFSYPLEAGLPVGGSHYGSYAMLEVHYNNPEMRADWVDDSGLRVYLTKKLRPNDAAVIELGLEYIDKMAIPPKQPNFQLSASCLPQCTGVALPEGGIKVFASQLHTHLTGTRVETRHYRKGVELPLLNQDKHYSTHFQEIRLLPQPVSVLPGDWLETKCWYDTTSRENITLGGFAITDEMCVNYIYYYPSTELEVCKSSISDQPLADYFDTLHKFEDQATGSQLPISESYYAIEWNPLRAEVLNKLYEEAPLYMQCNMSSGSRFPGDWTALHRPSITTPLPKEERQCGDFKEEKVNDLY